MNWLINLNGFFNVFPYVTTANIQVKRFDKKDINLIDPWRFKTAANHLHTYVAYVRSIELHFWVFVFCKLK